MSEEWSTVEVKDTEENPKVEIEIEGQEVEAAPEIVTEQSTNEGYTEEEQPKELEGIETQGAQKRIRQLIKQRKERDEELNTLRYELSSLKQTVKEKDTQLSSSLKTSIDSNESKLNSTLEIAKDIYKQAAESGDTDRMLSAQETISKTYADMSQIEGQKRAWEDYNNRVQAGVQDARSNPQQAAQQYDPKPVEWASKNSWFGTDNIMTYAALMIDNELKEEGYDPSDDEFYVKVDEVLRQRYPHKFADSATENQTPRLQDTSSNSAQVVAGASRTPKTSKSNKVKLTQEDVRLANKWGISLEQYATEKLKVEKAEGDYTSIY